MSANRRMMVLVGGALSLTASTALAQQPATVLDRFNPSFAGDPFYSVSAPSTVGNPGLHAGGLVYFVHDPLVLTQPDEGGETQEIGKVVTDQLYLHLDASVALWDRIAFNLAAPMVLMQDGDDNAIPGTGEQLIGPSGAAFGDLRLAVRARLYGENGEPFHPTLAGFCRFGHPVRMISIA